MSPIKIFNKHLPKIMPQKKAQFFALYLVFLTLFMIGAVLLIYYAQSKSVDNALISPASIYMLQDKKFIEETYEQGALLEVYEKVFSNKLSDNLIDDYEKEFCDKFVEDNEQAKLFRNFFFKDIFYNGKTEVEFGKTFDNNLLNAQTNFCYDIYSFEINGNDFVINRKEIKKQIRLTPLIDYSHDEIVFPVDLDYSFSKKYLIKQDDLGIYIQEEN